MPVPNRGPSVDRGGNGNHHEYRGPRYPYWGGYYYFGGCYYYFDGSYYSPALDRFSRYRRTRDFEGTEDAATGRDTFFFPPVPPPLGAPPPPKPPFSERFSPPPELASYVNEPFYTPLGSRLVTRDLGKKLVQRLETFRLTRSSLLAELRSQLAAVNSFTEEKSREQLEEFSKRQTPRIQQLEAEAEQLRADLLRNGLVSVLWGSGDGNEKRSWKLGSGSTGGDRESTLGYEFKVMRAAVFFQDGLSPAQRRLLREVAMELQVEAFSPKGADAAKGESLVFFQPETARLQMITTPSAELSAKLNILQKQKSELKSQLRDMLYEFDSAPASQRAQALRKLAEQQEAGFAVVETLAEDIRRTISTHSNLVGPPETPGFPAELAARIAGYQKGKQSLQKVLQTKIEETRNALGPAVLARPGMNQASENGVTFEASGASTNDDQIRSVREAVAAFNRDYADKFTALAREQELIRGDVAAWANENREANDGKSVDDLLMAFEQSRKQQEWWSLYEDYRDATLRPGLSPEQRRLLYEIGLEKLALPLPPGENLFW